MFSAYDANFGCYLQCFLLLDRILAAIYNVFCSWAPLRVLFSSGLRLRTSSWESSLGAHASEVPESDFLVKILIRIDVKPLSKGGHFSSWPPRRFFIRLSIKTLNQRRRFQLLAAQKTFSLGF
jgi:hypothetical protein